MDPNNPVVQLCAQGMQAEAEGRDHDATDLFRRAWQAAGDHYEACVAAHYLARHQPTRAQSLRWNQESLDRARLVGDDRVRGFLPSLHLNLARSYENLGQPAEANEHYRLAAAHLDDVPNGQYADWNRIAIAEGLGSTATATPAEVEASTRLHRLLARWCERHELKALALILPAYLGNLGTADDQVRLTTALHMVHAARWLPADEQHTIGELLDVARPGATG